VPEPARRLAIAASRAGSARIGGSVAASHSGVHSASVTISPPPAATIGSASRRCSPFPCGSGTYARGRPTAVSSAQVFAPDRHSTRSAAA
jgi:hypothetical protein